jgi:hypothetical protein
MTIKAFVFFLSLFPLINESIEKTRQLDHNGSKVKTTFGIDEKFIGRYAGSKSGFLELGENGNGVYRYDYSGLAADCPGEEIAFKWGFILDDSNEVVRLERSYGYSYPILYNCSGENAFQGCTKRSMVDFILVYKDGTITVSSSDDWVKTNR